MATPLADEAMKEMKGKCLGENGGCIHNVFAVIIGPGLSKWSKQSKMLRLS